MCEFLLQHGADVNSRDFVSYSCQFFDFLLIMVQVCVLPNNLCFGYHLSGDLSFVFAQVVGQVTCLPNYRYLFSMDF